MDSSMCSSVLDPEMWIIQGTLAWHISPEDRWGDSGEIQCRSNFIFTCGIRASSMIFAYLVGSLRLIFPSTSLIYFPTSILNCRSALPADLRM
ncbi:hypothetical protein Lal_00020881 [Lupinus albus]|nr:hypothetical protein Lal_00020881 [Lupinus albus]